jgi:hypothetical protein
MTTTVCMFDRSILAAQRTGHWTEPLRHHLATCDDCRATVRLTPALKSFAQETVLAHRGFPNYRIVLLRYEFDRRRQSLSLWDIVTLGAMVLVALAGIAAIVLCNMAAVTDLLSKFGFASALSVQGSSSNVLVFTAVGFLLVLLFVAQHYLAAEE